MTFRETAGRSKPFGNVTLSPPLCHAPLSRLKYLPRRWRSGVLCQNAALPCQTAINVTLSSLFHSPLSLS